MGNQLQIQDVKETFAWKQAKHFLGKDDVYSSIKP